MDGLTRYLNVEPTPKDNRFLCLVCLHGVGIFLLTVICVIVMLALGDADSLIKDAHEELTDLSKLLPQARYVSPRLCIS